MNRLGQLSILVAAVYCAAGCQVSRSADAAAIRWECAPDGLSPILLEDLHAAATRFLAATGESIRVVSGRRSLRHQAELMAGLTNEQLEELYCRNGYPSYIRAIIEHRRTNPETTSDDVYEILRKRTEGYVSSHLSGAAVDIVPPRANAERLKQCLTDCGFRVLDERSMGIDCIHATHIASPTMIIRE